MYPPARAVQRLDKLRKAREWGVHHGKLNKGAKERFPLPTVPVRIDLKVEDDKVKYQVGKVGVTNERRDYFEVQDDPMEEMDWSGNTGDVPQLEVGRIVEVRR